MGGLLPLEDAQKYVDESIATRVAGPNDVYGIISDEGGDFSKSDMYPEVKDYDGTADLINSIPFLLAVLQNLQCRLDCIEEALSTGITITIPIPDPAPIAPIPDPNP